MYIVELNILARPEIKSLKDLEGKKVGFHVRGGAPTLTGRILFERLGIKVEPIFVNNSIAYERMKTGEIAALLHPGGKPNDFLLKLKVEPGYHLLPVEQFDKFEDYYVPSALVHDDYPKLIPPGRTIQTLGIVSVLAVYNWPQGSDRHRRVARFIEHLISRFHTMQKPPYHPKWTEINLMGKVPGWTRYWAFEQALVRHAALQPTTTASAAPSAAALPALDPALAREMVARAAPHDPAEQERLYRQFVEWWSKMKSR